MILRMNIIVNRLSATIDEYWHVKGTDKMKYMSSCGIKVWVRGLKVTWVYLQHRKGFDSKIQTSRLWHLSIEISLVSSAVLVLILCTGWVLPSNNGHIYNFVFNRSVRCLSMLCARGFPAEIEAPELKVVSPHKSLIYWVWKNSWPVVNSRRMNKFTENSKPAPGQVRQCRGGTWPWLWMRTFRMPAFSLFQEMPKIKESQR